MECKFQVGDKVVCVDATDRNQRGSEDVPSHLIMGNVYEIREILSYTFANGNLIGVRLKEVYRNTLNNYDVPFGANRFKPIKKTDISIFREIAADPDKPILGNNKWDRTAKRSVRKHSNESRKTVLKKLNPNCWWCDHPRETCNCALGRAVREAANDQKYDQNNLGRP